MDNETLGVYLWELSLQTQCAVIAAAELDRFRENFMKEIGNDHLRIIQSLLIHAGIVSKFLWPSSARATKRGAELRRRLSISDDHVLSDRRLRNHFEHFDERIDDWISAGRPGAAAVAWTYRDWHFPTAHSVEGRNLTREYNPDTNKFRLFGEEYDLSKIAEALRTLHAQVEVEQSLLRKADPAFRPPPKS